MADYLSLAYGTVVFLGGVLGYVKAGSVMSLGSGIMFGSLLLYGVYRTTTNPRDTLFLLGKLTNLINNDEISHTSFIRIL
jgi:uncharacterized membrane protein (UPF0136 family)